MHFDVTDQADESDVSSKLRTGAVVHLRASVPLPPLAVVDVQELGEIRVGDRTVRRREVLFRPV
jgi:hypothetical protein